MVHPLSGARKFAPWLGPDPIRVARSDVEKEDLIGGDILRLPTLARENGTAQYLYGKAEGRPGCKMGHVKGVRPLGR